MAGEPDAAADSLCAPLGEGGNECVGAREGEAAVERVPIAPPLQNAPPCRQLGEAVHCEGRAERDAERSLLGERGADAEARGERL